MLIVSPGHVAFAVTMIALGILGLIKGDFASIWQPVPKGVPGREVLAYLCAFVFLACGIGLLWQRTAVCASRVLLTYLLLWLLLLRVPAFSSRPLWTFGGQAARSRSWWRLPGSFTPGSPPTGIGNALVSPPATTACESRGGSTAWP